MRQDIQCLRGCSIILVFIFHLLPDIFVNGFLGVDIFFVISGFLMAKNLTHSEVKTPTDILSFYYRRLRRILPLYYLIIMLTTVMVHIFLGDHLWANNQRYSLASIFLVTNQLIIHDQADYFNQFLSTEFSINAFLHMWSLTVEVQFYLLVPFIFFGLQFLKNDYLKVLSSKVLEYMGNISYVMYLVHWPLIAIFAPYTISNYVFLILVTLLSSIVLHHIFEQKYLKLGWKPLLTLLLALLMANIFLRSSHNFWIKTYPAEVQKVLDTNKALIREYWQQEANRIECFEEDMNEPSVRRGNGTASIMVIGNSYTLNFRNPIREQFRGNYSSFRYSSLRDGFGVCADNTAWSQASLKIYKRDVELHKPDVLFIISRYYNSIKQPILENDDVVSQMNENIKFYEKFTKKIFILGAHPLYQYFFVNRFIQDFATRPDDLESLHLNKINADREMRNVKKRFNMMKCTKCQLFDLSHVFLDGEKYLTFDRDQLLSYVDNTAHITAPGIKRCEPVLNEIARNSLNGL